jgi:hypothetical protein
MKKRNKLNKTETDMVVELMKPSFILTDETSYGTHTKDVVISWEDIPKGERAKAHSGIHIKRTTTIIADEMAYEMGLVDSITNEPIVEISYFTRPPSSISFEKYLVVSN